MDNPKKERIKHLMAENAWDRLLGLWGLQEFNADIEQSLSAMNVDEAEAVCFAMKHRVDELASRMKSRGGNETGKVRFLLDAVIYNVDYNFAAMKHFQNSFKVKSSYAYRLYDLYMNTGRVLNNIFRDCHELNKNLVRRFQTIRQSSDNEALRLYQELMRERPNDIKTIYRYGKLNQKMLQAMWKLTREEKKPLYEAANRAYHTVKEIYNNANEEYKRITANEYIKSCYGLSALYCDVCNASFSDLDIVKSQNGSIRINIYLQNHIEWNIDLLASAKRELDIVFERCGIPKELTEENIVNTANLETAIKPYDAYYRSAKIHWLMYVVFFSNDKRALRLDRKIQNERAISHWEKTVARCQYAADIKMKRLELRKNDMGGFIYELDLLAIAYAANPEVPYPTEEEFLGRYGKRNDVVSGYQYYKALTFLYNKNTRNYERATAILKQLLNSKSKHYCNKAKKVLDMIKDGRI